MVRHIYINTINDRPSIPNEIISIEEFINKMIKMIIEMILISLMI